MAAWAGKSVSQEASSFGMDDAWMDADFDLYLVRIVLGF